MSNKKDFDFFHITPVQIRFNDIDIMDHVNNSVYQNYYDLARKSYFEDVFQFEMQWKLRALVLAKITIEYFNPIFLNEKVEVHSKVYKLGNKSLQMLQEIVNPLTGEIKSKNDGVLVAFDVLENKGISIPEDWRSKIKNFEKDIQF